MLDTQRTVPAARIVMNVAYCAAVLDHVADELLARVAAQQAGDPRQPAEAGEPQQRAELEEAECRDRAQQVEPASLVDEVLALRPRAGDVVGEVQQEDHADRVVVEVQELVRLGVEREHQEDHHGEGEHGQQQDEEVVGVAVLAHDRLFGAHPCHPSSL